MAGATTNNVGGNGRGRRRRRKLVGEVRSLLVRSRLGIGTVGAAHDRSWRSGLDRGQRRRERAD